MRFLDRVLNTGWKKVLLLLCAVAVFITTYALILPAITIDKDAAVDEPGMEIVTQDSETTEEDGLPPEDAEPSEDAPPAELPPVQLNERNGDLTVSVDAGEGVLPEGARLVLDRVDGSPWLDSIENAVDDPVEDVRAVKIGFETAEGDPVQPLDSFTLTVSSAADDVLMTLDENGAAVLPAGSGEMTVDPDGVPVVALVETGTLTTTYLSASGKEYEVTVTFTEKANIPEGATLRLTELKESSRGYKTAVQALLDAGVIDSAAEDAGDGETPESAEPHSASLIIPLSIGGAVYWATDAENEIADGVGLDVLDLSILDADGNEVEPAAPVQVEIVMKSLPEDVDPADFYSSVTVTHICETASGLQPQIVAGNGAGLPGEITVENGEATAIFETDSFSQYTVTWRTSNSMTVHYGYMNGDTFVEFDPSVFSNGTPNIRQSNAPNYLIYDVEGYDYAYAYRQRGDTKGLVQPFLSYSSSNYRYWDMEGTAHGMSSTGDHIYMVYTPKATPPEGGTPLVIESGTPPAPPEILKDSTNRHDGTRELSLSITGHEEPMEFLKMMDLILVFDVSGSMNNNMAGGDATASNPSRLDRAKIAIKYLSNELLSDERVNNDGEKLNRMALVTFSDSARVEQGFTDDPTVYNQAVDAMTAKGGTNWEKSLQIANELAVDPDRATVVIFVTDGNPTWRMTRYNVSDANLRSQNDVWTSNNGEYYRNYSVFGRGTSDEQHRNYDAALIQAKSIVNLGKSFYSVGISSDVTNLEDFTEDAGVPRANSYTADNEEMLLDALMDIIDKMEAKSGYGGVDMVDGITGLTNLMAKTPIVGVDEASFTYTKTKNGVTQPWDPASEGANEAIYNHDTDSVEWHMGDQFQLEDGVTYTVSFIVWPSQEATDIVTELNNGTKTYDSLPPEVQAQIQQSNGFYTVKTNEDDAHVTYSKSRKTGGVVETVGDPLPPVYFQEVPPLVVNPMLFNIKKIFTDELTEGEDRQTEVTLILQRRELGQSDDDWEDVTVSYLDGDDHTVISNQIVLNEGNNWGAQFYISPGLVDSRGDECNAGHEYRLIEPGIDYHYEINSEIVRPMFYGFATEDDMNASTDGDVVEEFLPERVYIREQYLGDEDHDKALTAENIVKAGIDVRKYVLNEAGEIDTTDEEEFVIRGYILDPNGNPYTFNPDWDDRTDVSTGNDAGDLWRQHQNDPVAFHIYDKNNVRIGYKMHVASTDHIELRLKSGMRVRFVNVPQNCTYAFWEDDADMPTGYSFVSIEGYNLTRDEDGEYLPYEPMPEPTISADGRTLSGTVCGNVQHNVEVRNRPIKPNTIIVTKTVVATDGVTVIYPDQPFTIRGYIMDRYGDGYVFDPALDDRTDKSQGVPESEQATSSWYAHQDDPIAYNILDKDGNYVVYKGHFPTTDTFTVTLRGGERIEFLDVPPLSSYLIWEETEGLGGPDDLYEYVSISGEAVSNGGGVPTQPQPQTSFGEECMRGIIHESEMHTIRVKNRITRDYVELLIQKRDATDPTKKLNGACFVLYADEDHTIRATDFAGNEIPVITTGGFADDEHTVPLGLAAVGKLLPGTYYLVETIAPPGYNILTSAVVLTVTSDGVTVLQSENAAGSATVSAQDDLVTIEITNSSGTELPSTGGHGTLLYTSGGLLLMAAAMIYLVCARRRERRLE